MTIRGGLLPMAYRAPDGSRAWISPGEPWPHGPDHPESRRLASFLVRIDPPATHPHRAAPPAALDPQPPTSNPHPLTGPPPIPIEEDEPDTGN